MVGNWPHSILTLPRTAVTKVLILPLAKVSQIALVYIQNLMDFFLPHMSAMFYPIWSISQQMWAISPLSGAEEGELSNLGEAEGLASEEEEATEMMVVKWLMKGRVCLVGKKEDIWGSIIGGQLGKHQSSSAAIWASLKGVRKTTLVFRQQFW